MIEIEKIDVAESPGVHAALDSPGVGRVNGMAFRVAGWFRRPRGSANPKVRLHLAACAGAEPLHWELREMQSHERPEVPCHGWEVAIGFEGYVDAVRLPRTFRILISYRRESGTDCLIGEISGRRTFISAQYHARIQPIVVYHGGRMGSTAMMRALLAHPDIAIGDRHPFENNTAGYLAGISTSLLRTPSTGEEAEARWEDMPRLWNSHGANPSLSLDFQDRVSIEATLEALKRPIADFARSSIDRCYDLIAARANKPAARFFAEKESRPDNINALLWLYPRVKLILLTRDPRDFFRSARDFNARRGILAFGREFVGSDEEWIDLKSRLLCSFVDVFDNHPAADRLHAPFEEFITNTRSTLQRVCAFLEVDGSPATISAMEHAVLEETPESKFHRTRPSGEEIGSWQADLSPAHARRITEGASAYMQRFGYEPGPDADQGALVEDREPKQDASSHVPNTVEPSDVDDIVRQRDDMERASEQAVRAARFHENRANQMGRRLNEVGVHARELNQERDEAARFAKALEKSLKEVTEQAVAERAARERLQTDVDTYVTSLKATMAGRDEALQAAQTELELLKAETITEREARERLQVEANAYVASLKSAIDERDQALQAAREEAETLKAALAKSDRQSTQR
jgi:hypothetical protein